MRLFENKYRNKGLSSHLKFFILLIGWMFLSIDNSPAFERANIIVSKDGRGHFKTIQAALDSVPTKRTQDWIILVKNGTYSEKIFITKSYVTIVGENWDSTKVVYPELREEWNKNHDSSDWGAGVVNIDSSVTDITLADITVYNNHGSLYGTYKKHQFAVRGMGTRIMLLHCKIISDGGDALSLWNRNNGMYYHSNCYFEGWVDYVCPRGWCYITESKFYGHNTPSASIWHDGSKDKNQKFVIANSYFDGVPGFPLGRNHLDGQIYLLNCRFSKNMADRPFYRPPSSPREWQWGDRHYFYNCHRESLDYSWFKDNLSDAEGSPTRDQITALWTFDKKWNPEKDMISVLPFAFLPNPENTFQVIGNTGIKLSWIAGRNAESHNIYFGTTNPPIFIKNQKELYYQTSKLEPNKVYYWRIDEVSEQGIIPGMVWEFSTTNK
jgi:pectinesterase